MLYMLSPHALPYLLHLSLLPQFEVATQFSSIRTPLILSASYILSIYHQLIDRQLFAARFMKPLAVGVTEARPPIRKVCFRRLQFRILLSFCKRRHNVT
jgi:hypothetical protein